MFQRRLFVRLALVLLVALPLRSMTAVAMSVPPSEPTAVVASDHGLSDHCDPSGAPAATREDAPVDSHGSCSVCCCAAVIATHEFHWQVRRDTPSAPSPHIVAAAPAVILDGPERPPRSSFA